MIYDINDNIVENPDLSKGYLEPGKRIKEEASPIDNVNKFAWADEDYEDVQIYIQYSPEQLDIENTPNADDDRDSMLVDLEYRLTMLELGV